MVTSIAVTLLSPSTSLEAPMTRTIQTLIEIMLDEDAAPRRRVQAARGLIEYEAPPEVAEAAKEFLAQVYEDSDQNLQDRLDALEVARKAEARKIAVRVVPAKEDFVGFADRLKAAREANEAARKAKQKA
jgi:hypothetical protein